MCFEDTDKIKVCKNQSFIYRLDTASAAILHVEYSCERQETSSDGRELGEALPLAVNRAVSGFELLDQDLQDVEQLAELLGVLITCLEEELHPSPLHVRLVRLNFTTRATGDEELQEVRQDRIRESINSRTWTSHTCDPVDD